VKSVILFALIPLILSIVVVSLSFDDASAVSKHEVICIDKVWIENTKGKIACVTPATAEKLVERGWGTMLVEDDEPMMGQETKADQVYYNGIVYTVDDENPWAQAFAIKDGKFIAVGANEQVNQFEGSNTLVIDLQKKMVLPSFIDTHQHWDTVAEKEQSCPIPGPFDKPTLESTRKKIEECVSEGNDFNGWFVGIGYSESIFPNGANKEFLDEIFPDRPAFMEAENGHDALVNSKGLEVLGITKDTEEPPGGRFAKDQNGELTGRLIEDPARDFAKDRIPFPPNDPSFYAKGFKIAMDKLNAVGITGFIEGLVKEKHLASWELFLEENEPTVRGRLAIEAVGYGGPGTELYGKDIIEMAEKYDLKDWPVMVKIMADGTTEGENSALLEPYVNNPEKEHDKLTLPDELFRKVIKDLDEHDLQIKVHVNGDASARAMLDVFEEIVNERGFNVNRHHLAHNALVDPEDFSRYREIGVAAEWIPALAGPSQYYESQIPILGEERLFEKAYPLGSIANEGGIVAAGTDWALTPKNVFFNMQATVTRQDPLDPENEMVLNEKHKMTIPQVIQMYTINGAHVMYLEEITGSIEDGKSADFIVIDKNIFDVPENQIKDIKILQTFFEGNEVYRMSN